MNEDQAPLQEMEQCLTMFTAKEKEIKKVWKNATKAGQAVPKIQLCNQLKDFATALEEHGVIM